MRIDDDGPSVAARAHEEKRRALLRAAPHLRTLRGPNPWSVLCVLGLACAQMTIAWSLRDGGVVRVAAVAFFVGQLLLHAGGALTHEAAHGLILRGRAGRIVVDTALELLLTSFGHHAQYQLDHRRSHHPYLGDYRRDYEHKDAFRFIARRRLAARRPVWHAILIALQVMLDALPLGFLVSDDVVFALERRLGAGPFEDPSRRVPKVRVPRRRRLWLGAVSAGVLAALAICSPWSLLYQLWSLSFFQGRLGISNVGQVLSEHPDVYPEGPATRSTYGAWNLLLFNTGYHDEHHTFPTVAWNRLPQLRAAAPEAFVAGAHGYVGWWLRYVFRRAPRRPSKVLDAASSRVGAGSS